VLRRARGQRRQGLLHNGAQLQRYSRFAPPDLFQVPAYEPNIIVWSNLTLNQLFGKAYTLRRGKFAQLVLGSFPCILYLSLRLIPELRHLGLCCLIDSLRFSVSFFLGALMDYCNLCIQAL
jgi:hypothetical protein